MKTKSLIQIAARNESKTERQNEDFYATDPKAMTELLKVHSFDKNVWECCCGKGHLADELRKAGYNVLSSDLENRGYGIGGVDFLKVKSKYDGDIITNPPYKNAIDIIKHALDIVKDGHQVAMFLKIQFLEGIQRKDFFKEYPPKYIYVSSSRIQTAMNGDFDKYNNCSSMCFAWFIWEKGYKGDPVVKWFN